MFKILDFDRQYYEATFNFSTYQGILQKENDDLSEAILEIFSNFQYDASAIISAASLVLHGYILDTKPNKLSKKVNLIIENYPESNINDIKANMI